MLCPACRRAMNEIKGTHHKKKKWVCPRCGRIRMQKLQDKVGKGRPQRLGS